MEVSDTMLSTIHSQMRQNIPFTYGTNGLLEYNYLTSRVKRVKKYNYFIYGTGWVIRYYYLNVGQNDFKNTNPLHMGLWAYLENTLT